MELQDLWFFLIAVLWVGYFFLEGFDFGVGILHPFVAKTDGERRVFINSIGPVWDGNEVWLLVAGGATFAAFPEWYATLFSGFYLPLFLILFALIIRGVAFEYRSKVDNPQWRTRWDWAVFVGSVLPAILWGVAFANIVRGVEIVHSSHAFHYTGGFFALLNPYALLGGITTLMLFTLHGALFLSLKTTGELHERVRRLARLLSPATALVVIGFLVWTYFNAQNNDHTGLVQWYIPCTAMALIAIEAWLLREERDGWAFAVHGLAIMLVITTLFLNLYPNVMPSSINDAYSLTVDNASATPYTLKVMTIVAGFMVPVVLAYQAWTYWIFRKRISVPPASSTNSL